MNYVTNKDEFEEVYKFNKVEELFNMFAHWNDDLNLEGFIFRGHGKDKYKLIPNSLREDNKEELWKISPFKKNKYSHKTEEAQIIVEYSILREFYKHSDFKGLKVPVSKLLRENLHKNLSYDHVTRFNIDGWIHNDLLEITSLAQHYGIPTRLLDWTYDPYIAFYFAFHDAIKGKKVDGNLVGNLVIFALNKEYLSTFRNRDMNIQFITPRYSENPNLSAQKGLFTHYNKTSIEKGSKEKRYIPIDRTPLDEFIKNNFNKKASEPPILKKFIIPCSEAKRGCQILDKMGYDSGNVFPGYSGIAKFILEKHEYE